MPAYEFEGIRPVVDPAAYVHPTAVLVGDVIVGPGCMIGPGASLRGDLGRLTIMDGANVQDNCILHTFPGREVVIEGDGHVGHGAILHGCTVKRNAMVGMHAVVMDEAVIGEEAFVAAMSFVKAGMHVPPRTLVAGIPAKAVRALRADEIEWKSEGTRIYRHLAERCLATVRPVEPLARPEPGRRRVPAVPYDTRPTPPAPPPPR